jgi:hypothetical protein
MNIPPEAAGLLTLVKASLSATLSAPERCPSPIDWTTLQRLARRHRLGPLLHYGLCRSRILGIPEWLRADWEEQHQDAVAIALYFQNALLEIAAAFDDHRVPFILLKGEALSNVLYPENGLRPYDDIDLLIRSEAYDAAKSILTKLGFRLRHPSKEVERRQLFGEVVFNKEGLRHLAVDLHWDTAMASWERQSSFFSEHEAWASIDQVCLGGRTLPALSGEALLLYLCVHLAFHHTFDGLILLCDLLLVLRREAGRIDWERLVTMATRYRCRRALYYSLTFARALLGAEVPAGILDRVRPPASNQALMPAGRLLFRDTVVPLMLERWVKFLLIDTRQGRWRAVRALLGSSHPFLARRNSPQPLA